MNVKNPVDNINNLIANFVHAARRINNEYYILAVNRYSTDFRVSFFQRCSNSDRYVLQRRLDDFKPPEPTEAATVAYSTVEAKTLFYDIFLDPVSNRLIGIGPALLNLESELFPMAISVSSQTLEHEINQIKGVT